MATTLANPRTQGTSGAPGATPRPAAPAVSTATLLGEVMFLVAAAIGFAALGAYLGRDLSEGAALALSIGAVGMVLAQSLGGERFRIGGFALGWLFAVAVVLGLALGPVLASYASADPAAVTQAAGATALVVAATGAGGLLVSRDLTAWVRPLTFVVLGLVLVSLVVVLTGTAGSPWLSLGIGTVSALLLIVDFNVLRRSATEDDVVWLATGIFVSIVNIFLSLLDLFSSE